MGDRDEEIRKHNQKWKKWNQELKKQQTNPPLQNIKQGQSPYNYAVKLIQKLDSSDDVGFKRSLNKFEDQLEGNACYVCMQLMVPPKKPIILFPCSHNICKLCLFEEGENRKKKQSDYTLKLKKCPICKIAISNHAQNRNLMTLICTYTDNKHLLEKQLQLQEREKLEQYEEQKTGHLDDIQKVRIRCSILDAQRRTLDISLAKDSKQLTILQQALDRLEEQSKRNSRQSEDLREQAKLITQFIKQKQAQLQKVEYNIQSAEQKKKITEKTLQPLRIQREKMEILECAKQFNE